MNGRKWKTRAVRRNSAQLRRSDGTATIGMCDDNTSTIYYASDLSGTQLQKVIIHEITHACMFSYGIILDAEAEEIFCELLANYGTEIIKTAELVFKRL